MLIPGVAARRSDSLVDRDLFVGLETATCILLAVSGGPDSMALMHLAARWAERRGGHPALHVATVDHALRDGSRAEADFVGAQAADLGLTHSVLTWNGARPRTRIQERARAARYALLAQEAERVGATHVVTAHHADDQAETVMLRLGRGSGIGGLAAMRVSVSLAPGLTLARPLLDVPKAALIAFCEAEGQPTVDDPSNRDPAYARVRLRGQAGLLADVGLDRVALLRLARRMSRADAALETETTRIESRLAPDRTAGSYRLTLVDPLEPEILLRLLQRAVHHVAPDGPGLRLERLESLADALRTALDAGQLLRATLGGTRITLTRDRSLAVCPEAARRRGRAAPQNKDTMLDFSASAPVKAELTRPLGSLGKTRGAAYIA